MGAGGEGAQNIPKITKKKVKPLTHMSASTSSNSPVCPWSGSLLSSTPSVRTSCPLLASQIFIVWSVLPEAIM